MGHTATSFFILKPALFFQSMTLDEALKVSLTVLKQVMEEKVSGSNVEVAAVTPDRGFHRYPQQAVEQVIATL